MAMVTQYFATVPSIRYVFKSGMVAHFIHGRYRTTKEEEIAELDAAVAAGSQHIYIKADAKVVDTASDDPLVGLKQRIIEEYEAQKRAMGNTSKEVNVGAGTTEDTTSAKVKEVKAKIADAIEGSAFTIPTVSIQAKPSK